MESSTRHDIVLFCEVIKRTGRRDNTRCGSKDVVRGSCVHMGQ